MKLSICCITYNQEKYISQAIESMLAQQTNFDFEIVIGEDGSTDSTRKICEVFKAKYPGKINLLPNEGNLGMIPNFVRTLKACKGDYVALCEGDDYWINNSKLQKQVDFLEANNDFAICFHRAYELFGSKKLQPERLNVSEKEEEYTIEYLARGNFMHTASVVYRNFLIKEYPTGFEKSPVGDYVIHMLNARHGKIKYLPDLMSVYRRHDNGAWSLKSQEYRALSFLSVVDLLMGQFDGRVKEVLIKRKAVIYSELAIMEFNNSNIAKATAYVEKAVEADSSFKEIWLTKKYPFVIKSISESKSYKYSRRIVAVLRKLKLIKSKS